jgi:hypothetical protein
VLTGSLANSTANGQGMQGVTLLYEFNLMIENNRLLAEVADLGINPQAKALSESGISAMTLINQGADLAAGQGMSNAVSAAAREGQGARGPSLAGFGAVSAWRENERSGAQDGFSNLFHKPVIKTAAGTLRFTINRRMDFRRNFNGKNTGKRFFRVCFRVKIKVNSLLKVLTNCFFCSLFKRNAVAIQPSDFTNKASVFFTIADKRQIASIFS